MADTVSTAHAPMAPELQDVIAQNEAIIADARALVDGMTNEQFNWKPSPERWSVAECVHHLNLANNIYIPLWRKTIQDARTRGLTGTGPYRYGWLSSKFTVSLEPPVKRKHRAPRGMMEARSDHDRAEVLAEFERSHRTLIDVIASADGVDLKRARHTSVFSKLIKLSLGQWFTFNASHDRRHLWQARNVTKEPGFPSTSSQ